MTLAIRAKALFTATNGELIEDGGVLVRDDGRIAEVGPFKSLDLPTAGRVLEMGEHTLAPGLIDSHSHISIQTVGTMAEHVPDSDAAVALHGVHRLGQDLASGVTTMRTLGDRHFLDIVFRQAQIDGLVRIPRLRVAGHLLQSSLVKVSVSEAIADGPDAIRRYLRQTIHAGADWVKYYATPNSRAENPVQPIFDQDEVETIFREARYAGRPVASHCHGGVAADWCIELGVDSLEHGLYLEDRQLQAMGEKGVVLVPTTGVVLLQPSENASARLLEAQERARTFLRRARRYGVNCIPGSDAVHGNLAFELKIMIDCGWRPLEALAAVTREAAGLLRMGEAVGTLEAGKLADLVAFRGNPSEDPTAFDRIDLVVQGGAIVHQTGSTSNG